MPITSPRATAALTMLTVLLALLAAPAPDASAQAVAPVQSDGDAQRTGRSPHTGPRDGASALWQVTHPTDQQDGGTTATPVIDGLGQLVEIVVDTQAELNDLVAYDLSDGSQAWRLEGSGGGQCLATDGDRIFYTTSGIAGSTALPDDLGSGVAVIDAADGSIIASHPIAFFSCGADSLHHSEATGWLVFSGRGGNDVHGLNPDTGDGWTVERDGHGGERLALTTDGRHVIYRSLADDDTTTVLELLDVTTGDVVAQLDLPEAYDASGGRRTGDIVAVEGGFVLTELLGGAMGRVAVDSDAGTIELVWTVVYERDEDVDESGLADWISELYAPAPGTLLGRGDSTTFIDLATGMPIGEPLTAAEEPAVGADGLIYTMLRDFDAGQAEVESLVAYDGDAQERFRVPSTSQIFGESYNGPYTLIGPTAEGLVIGFRRTGAGVQIVAWESAGAVDDLGPGNNRIDEADGKDAATRVCQLLVSDGGADEVVLARDDDFADALVGTQLPDVDCILFTPGGPDEPLDPDTRAEIDRALEPGGRVWALGGTDAVSAQAADELDGAGFDVQRLSGPTRFETAEAIAAQAFQDLLDAGRSPADVIIGYGLNWPDAITAGAYARASGSLVVLTPTSTLHPTVRNTLNIASSARPVIVGGESVVSASVQSELPPETIRVAGQNRMDTAAEIARQLWPAAADIGSSFVFANLDRADGWTLALAAAPLSARLGGPQLGVRTNSLPSETRTYLEAQGVDASDVRVFLGDISYVSDETLEEVGQLEG